MPSKNRLTNNSDETDISSLLSGDTIFTIPYFQRAYKWKPARLKQLNDDILNVVDEHDQHFLGAIIVHGRRSNPSDPDVFDVIDGQQRVTTLFLYLSATVKLLSELGETAEARGLFLKYLVIGRDTAQISNLKLHSCKEDRAQLNYVFRDILSDTKFVESLGGLKIRLLPSTGDDRGTLRNNYRSARRFLGDQFDQAGLERIREIYTAILSCVSVVQIDVTDPTNGPKIFDSLNSRQEPMTVGDLVRNEIFSRVADENPATIELIDENHWQPFYKGFQSNGRNLFDLYFFPYGLIHNPNLKKSEVYTALREKWRGINDPDMIIEELSVYQRSFIDLLTGNNLQGQSKPVSEQIRRFHDLGAPSSIYPFMMQLSNALRDRLISEADGLSVMSVIESFLVRRAICGHEPTGLHAVFKRLWVDCKGEPERESVVREIGKHRTVTWPSDSDLKHAIETRSLYGAGITRFLILEYDRGLGGDRPANVPWIEHVLPENPVKEWFEEFSKAEHSEFKDTFANLLPLSVEMNTSISNKPYREKRERYRSDSMFKSTREFARGQSSWTVESLKRRAEELSAWAVTRWSD